MIDMYRYTHYDGLSTSIYKSLIYTYTYTEFIYFNVECTFKGK